MEISDFKNDATLLSRYYSKILELSNEILCILVAQGTTKLQGVKFGGQRKNVADHTNNMEKEDLSQFFSNF